MANVNPPKKNHEFRFRFTVEDMANPGKAKVNPTIAAGDFKVDTDGAGAGNPATAVTVDPAGTKWLYVVLSAGEMNGDIVTFTASDQTSPAEWADRDFCFNTTA